MRTYSGKLNKDNIPDNGIFVFGSNKIGINGNPYKGTGGAALVAQLEFGVKHGERMINKLSSSGKAYGLVTVHAPKNPLFKSQISENIKKLYDYASENPNLDFYIAYDGLDPNARSLNGYKRVELAELFSQHIIPSNIIFEDNFLKLVSQYV